MATNSNNSTSLASNLDSANTSNFSDSNTPGSTTLLCDKNQSPTDNAGTSNSKKTKNRHLPCDVSSFEITDKTSKQSVICSTKFDKKVGTKEEIEKLGGYDLLLETVADYEVSTGAEPKIKADIVLDAKNYVSALTGKLGKCPDKKHLKYNLKAIDKFGADKNATWIDNAHPKIELIAPPSKRIENGGFFKTYWDFNDQKRLFIAGIETCGIRDQGLPVKNLLARIRVYPNITYKLEFKLPALGKFKGEASASLNVSSGETTLTLSKEKKSIGGDLEKSSTEVKNGIGSSITKETFSVTKDTDSGKVTETITSETGRKDFKNYSKNTSSTVTSTISSTGISKDKSIETGKEISSKGTDIILDEKNLVSFEPKISLKRNDQELDVSKTFNDLLDTGAKIRDAFSKLQDLIPTVGFKASIDIAILEGVISGTWGNEARALKTSKRLVLVDHYFDLRFDLTLLAVKLSFSAGLDFKIEGWFKDYPIVELVLKVSGEAAVTVAVNTTVHSRDALKPIKFTVKPTAKIEARAVASAVGLRVEAVACATFGASVDADLKISLKVAPYFDVNIKREKLNVKVYTYSGRKRRNLIDKDVVKEGEIWKGKIP